MLGYQAWVSVWKILQNKHGLGREGIWALSPEVRYGLIEDALKDLSAKQRQRIKAEFGGSYTAYKNHCAQRRGFKNTYEQRVANWKKRGFARPQDYYDDWARRKGFTDFWHYRKDLKEKETRRLINEAKSILEAGNPVGIEEG